MLIFGKTDKELKRGKISNVTCSTCGEFTTMRYHVEVHYFHLYWIPIFPYEKNTFIECDSCDDIFYIEGVSENIKNKLKRENELKSARIPIWMFSGLIFLITVVPYCIIEMNQLYDDELIHLNKPKIGDVYSLDNLNTEKFTTMKIVSIDKDSVRFILNDSSVDKMTNGYMIEASNYYSTKKKSFSKVNLIKMYNKDIIYSIYRKKDRD